MNVLVIGGTGFISKRIVRRLLGDGHAVTVLNRGSSAPDPSTTACRRLVADRKDERAMRTALGNASYEAVYDMVAYEPAESEMMARLLTDRVGRFIHCSTVSVYMVSNLVQCPIDEDQWTLPVMPFEPRNPYGMEYGLKKRACEQVLWNAHHPERFAVSMLRPTYVSGPGDPMRRDYFWIQRILDGKPLLVPGSGDLVFHQVYVDDVARAFVRLLAVPASVGRAYNMVGEEAWTLNHYLDRLATMLGRECTRVHVDREVFEALPFSSCPGEHVFPFDARWSSIFSLDRTRHELGFRTTPFETWMPPTIEWYRSSERGDSAGYRSRNDEVAFARRWQALRSEMIGRSMTNEGEKP